MSAWKTSVGYRLSARSDNEVKRFRLAVWDRNGDQFKLLGRRDRNVSLIKKALRRLSVHWPSEGFKFKADENNDITEIE